MCLVAFLTLLRYLLLYEKEEIYKQIWMSETKCNETKRNIVFYKNMGSRYRRSQVSSDSQDKSRTP